MTGAGAVTGASGATGDVTADGGVVLVTGPPRAGVSAMVDELRRRMPSYRFVDRGGPADADPPAVVVFVVSAVAPIVESDCELADLAATQAAAVIAVVSKIDDHHAWRRVLAADRERLGRFSARWTPVPWVGVAAAPRLGRPHMDDLVELLDAALHEPTLSERNTLRVLNSRLNERRAERERLLRHRRLAATERLASRRVTLQETRLALTHRARQRCAELRADLLDDAAAAGRGQIGGFGLRARERCADVLAEVDEDIGERARDLAAGCGVGPAPSLRVPDPPLASRRLEAQLMAVLGAGFGLGVAVVVTRVVAGVAPQLAVVGLLAGGTAGLLTTAWVIRARALLHARAVLQAWVTDTVAGVRAAAEERVATRMLAVEAAMASAGASDETTEDAEIGRRIGAVEAEIRELTRAQGRRSEGRNMLPIGRPPGYGHLNRSCE